jgi:Domain of unknown function (DUF4276)
MVKVFIEGGGDGEALKTECRRAFSKLLEKAGFKGRLPRLVACGSRRNAFDQFCAELAHGQAILLVDAEGPVTQASPWTHVAQREGDKWTKPNGATDAHLHLMVQCMEAWYLADRVALLRFYGQGFNENALPAKTANLEDVRKNDVYTSLERATQHTKTKGRYGKSEHSFKLLATLDPDLIRNASPWAARFFVNLDGLLR